MTPTDAPKSASALAVAELVKKLRAFSTGQLFVDAASTLKQQSARIAELEARIEEQKGYAQKYVNECIVLNGRIAGLHRQLKIALSDLKQCQDMWSARTKAALADSAPKVADAAGGKHD
jgi:hypothetical protein